MYPRKQLDIPWKILAQCLVPHTTREDRDTLKRLTYTHETLVTLSVRSAFHLALSTLSLPRGSEVLVSAVTIPHMIDILHAHGLVPVPVDLNPLTCQPRIDLLRTLRTDKTRAVLVAHLFGATIDVDPIAAFCTAHGLLLWEDCAQAFTGTFALGHPDSDLTMWSFGTIKTATALGGAVVRVRDGSLRRAMDDLHRSWPLQNHTTYRTKVLKSAFLKVCAHPILFGALKESITRAGHDYDALLMAATRGFPGASLIAQISTRPSAALVCALARRLHTVAPNHTHARARAGQEIVDALGFAPGLGAYATHHTFWLFPLTARNPPQLVQILVDLGLDATLGGTSLFAVPDNAYGDSTCVKMHMERTVYVPAYAQINSSIRRALIEVLRREVIPVEALYEGPTP